MSSQCLLIGQVPRRWGPSNFRWLAYTANALRRLGHRVSVVAYHDAWIDSPALMRRIEPQALLRQGFGRYRMLQTRAWQRRVLRLARRLRPDLILILKGESLSEELLVALKRCAAGPLVTWWTDDPWDYPEFLKRATLFDHVFMWDRSYLSRLQELGVRRTHFLPCACDETTYRPMRLSGPERRRLSCDVAFVATYFEERGQVVEALAGSVDLGVWGSGWNERNVRTRLNNAVAVRGGAIDDRTAVRIYSAAKIGLNVHHSQSRFGGLNMRTFELPGCGLFQITNRLAGIEELLRPDEEIVCYDSYDELRRLIRHYLADEPARLRIAARGRERVLAEHTYAARMRTLSALARTS